MLPSTHASHVWTGRLIVHELSIAENILNISLQEAKKHGASKVRSIKIKMGVLKELLPECINYYFKIISRGSMAEDAVIEIEKLPMVVRCKVCGSSSKIEFKNFRCPACQSQNLDIIQGNEFYIESLEVD